MCIKDFKNILERFISFKVFPQTDSTEFVSIDVNFNYLVNFNASVNFN